MKYIASVLNSCIVFFNVVESNSPYKYWKPATGSNSYDEYYQFADQQVGNCISYYFAYMLPFIISIE